MKPKVRIVSSDWLTLEVCPESKQLKHKFIQSNETIRVLFAPRGAGPEDP